MNYHEWLILLAILNVGFRLSIAISFPSLPPYRNYGHCDIVICKVFIATTEFYHSWNRNIVPNCLESWEPLKKIMQSFV